MSTENRHTWVPSKLLEQIGVEREQKTVDFILSNGKCLTRHVGFAIVRWGRHFTVDEVVFCENDDVPLLGTRSLEGLNLIVDLPHNRLISPR